MKFYLGVTDNNWYQYLSRINPEDVNFWQLGGQTSFIVLQAGAPFLFKLKGKLNAIGGVGFFSSHTFLPISVAWDTFRNSNGGRLLFLAFKRGRLKERGGILGGPTEEEKSNIEAKGYQIEKNQENIDTKQNDK